MADSIRIAHDRLGQKDIHVWLFNYETMASRVTPFRHFLSDDEIERACRFYTNELQERFVLSRGFLRSLLAVYLERNPQELRFAYGENGKPEVEQEAGQPRLHFNLAHSGSMAACALTMERSVGIDLEEVRVVRNLEQICARFFSKDEAAKVCAVEEHLREDCFFRCWTAKEAFIKATGEGLSRSLDSFMVAFLPNETPQIQVLKETVWVDSPWRLWHLEPVAGYRGALVAENASDAIFSIYTWDDEKK